MFKQIFHKMHNLGEEAVDKADKRHTFSKDTSPAAPKASGAPPYLLTPYPRLGSVTGALHINTKSQDDGGYQRKRSK